MNIILNSNRTLKNRVTVDEVTARSPECQIDIQIDDIFIENAPPIPEGMYAPQLTVDFEVLLAADPGAQVWVEAEPALRDADAVTKNVQRIKAKAGEVIYARYSVENQNNMQARHSEIMSIMAGTYPNDDGTFAAARALTYGEQQELIAIKQAWVWVKSVRDTSNAEELLNTPADDIVWPL